MSTEIRDAVRAVLEAARTWREARHHGPMDYETKTTSEALVDAVDALDALLLPRIEEYEGPMEWRKVIAGDEARGADGRYHRVLAVFSTGPRNPDAGPMDTGNAVVVEIQVQGKPKRYRKAGNVETVIRRRISPEATALAALEAAGLDISTVISQEA